MTATNYSWKESEFQEFGDWEKKQNRCIEDRYERYITVIDWVIKTNKNTAREFFGVSLGKSPYQNCHVHSAAEEFLTELKIWQKHRQADWLVGKMNDSTFTIDRDRGSNDGYWLQPKASQSDGYLYGYCEGISLKMDQGYTLRGLDTDSPYLHP